MIKIMLITSHYHHGKNNANQKLLFKHKNFTLTESLELDTIYLFSYCELSISD